MTGLSVQDEDQSWVERWQAGDEAALTALVEKYRERVRAVAYRFLQNQAEAEDIAQETFIRLVRARERYTPWPKLRTKSKQGEAGLEAGGATSGSPAASRGGARRPKAKFSSFLFTITHNLCLNALRHRKRHPTQSMDATVSAAEDAPARQWADPSAVSAAQVLEDEEQVVMVRQAVDRLPPDERMAMILDHWEDQPLEEIAAVLRKSVPAVKSLLFRARAKLRISLAAYCQK